MNLHKQLARTGFLFLLMTLMVSCSHYKTVRTKVFEATNSKIELVHDIGPGGVLLKKGFTQPINVKPEEFADAMRTLHYSDAVFLWQEKERPIFSDTEIETLAPQFAQALAKADSDQMISFSIKTWKKDMIFGSDKYTNGLLFFNDKGMNWAFANINLTEGQDGEIFLGNPMDSPPQGAKVALSNNQTYYRPVAPSWYEAKEFPNWVIAPNPFQSQAGVAAAPAQTAQEKESPTATEPVAESQPPKALADTKKVTEKAPAPMSTKKTNAPIAPAPAASADESEQRLRRLKNLLDEKLISPQDYDQKKKEILKNL